MKIRKLLTVMITGILLAYSSSFVQARAMEISQNGVDFICGLEGFHEKCYSDYSQSSIGYGTKCPYSSVQPHKSGLHSITREDAMLAMQTGITNTYAPKVKNQTAGLNLNQNQFDALVSLAYNCGGGLNRIYNSPLVKYLRGELTESQARTQYANYLVKAGGKFCQGLYNRRVKEANFFFDETCYQPAYANVSLQGDRTVFMTGEDVLFTVGSDDAEVYYLTVSHEGEALFTEKLTHPETLSVHAFEETGIYTVSCSAGNAYGVTQSESLDFEILEPAQIADYITGDINLDEKIDIEDLKLLQEYLQCHVNLTEEQFNIADMNQDGVCNVFDLNKLKYMLLEIQ